MGIDYTTHLGPFVRCRTRKVDVTERQAGIKVDVWGER